MNLNFKQFFKLFLAISLFFAIAASAAENIEPPPPPPQEKINVFAVVSDDMEKAFKDAANALKETEQIDSFPMQGFQVHCTLYMTQYPAGMKNEVLAKVEELASTTRQFEVKTTGLEITSGNWFFMNLDRNHNLQALSNSVVELLSPMRAQSDFVPEWAKPFPKKVESISKFGSPNVYEEFNPHLTFLAKAEIEKLNNFLKNHAESEFSKPITGKIIAIGAGIADRNGQVPEPWKIFPLQPAE